MKNIFRTAGAILAAGAILSACGSGSTSNTSGTGSSSTGTTPSSAKVTLPHGNTPTPPIAALMKIDKPFAKQITNPKDWAYSKTFSRYIFVGPYTSGVPYQRVRDAKIAAMHSMELLTLQAKYATKWPTTLNGFNYDAFGQGAISQALVTSFYKSAVAQGHHAMIPVVPSEETIIESPVGKLTAKQMANTAGQPQNATLGICVPHKFEAVSANNGSLNVLSTAFGISPTNIYFADYGNTNVIFTNSSSFTNGVDSNPTSTCVSFH